MQIRPCQLLKKKKKNHRWWNQWNETDLEVGEEGDVAGPLDGGEEESGGQLADVVDAHDVVGRLHALAVAGRRVRLGPQQQ